MLVPAEGQKYDMTSRKCLIGFQMGLPWALESDIVFSASTTHLAFSLSLFGIVHELVLLYSALLAIDDICLVVLQSRTADFCRTSLGTEIQRGISILSDFCNDDLGHFCDLFYIPTPQNLFVWLVLLFD